jgi:hypothetical protein
LKIAGQEASLNSYLYPRNHGCRITQFSYQGYEALALQNQTLRITVLPGKGSDIIEFLYKPLDLDFMWPSYPGLQAARLGAPSVSHSDTLFLDYYAGGWQEILPNFGDPCEYKGAKLGLHAEVSLLPWCYRIIRDEPYCVSVELSVECRITPFVLQKTLTLASDPMLKIEERLTNPSHEAMDCAWGHHPALGAPFLDETCRIFVPPCRVRTLDDEVSPNSRLEKAQDSDWPFVRGRNGETVDLSRIPPPSVRSHDMAFLCGFNEGWYAVINERKEVGFGMAWESRIFKYLWFWQVYRGWSGYPWYGTSYNVGIEPCTSFPPSLVKAIEHGTQLRLGPGESTETRLCVVVFRGLASVARITLGGEVQITEEPT